MNVPHRSDKNACDTAPVGHGLTIHLIALLLPIALLVMAGQFATNNYQNRSNAAEAAKIYTQAQVLLTAERIETILRATTVVVTSLRSFVIDEPDSRMLEPFVRDLLDQNKTILGIAVAIQSSGRGNRARYWYRNDNGLIVYREMDDAESAFHQAEWYAAPVASGKSEWTEPYFDAYGAETNTAYRYLLATTKTRHLALLLPTSAWHRFRTWWINWLVAAAASCCRVKASI